METVMAKPSDMPAWTYSRLESFETCPRKFYHLKVIKDVVEPPSVHADWGTRVHTALEDFVKHGVVLPEGMTQWEPLALKIARLPGDKLPEYQFALDRDFSPVDWGQAWTRGIADLLVLNGDKAAVMDYKTGKRKPSEQLQLYAAYTFATFPEVQQVTTAFVWLKDRKIDKAALSRANAAGVWRELVPRVRRLEHADRKSVV